MAVEILDMFCASLVMVYDILYILRGCITIIKCLLL